jgi:hypothetical protein
MLGYELVAVLPLAVGLVGLGLQPALLTRLLESTVRALVETF